MENAVAVTSRKRPAGVWVICVYYFVTVGLSLFSLGMVHRAAASLTPQQKSYLVTLTTTDYVLTIISAGLTLSGVVALFLLRRAAFPLFCASLAMTMSFTIWHILTRHWLAAVGPGGLIGAAFGWIIMLVACIYSARLSAQGTLK